MSPEDFDEFEVTTKNYHVLAVDDITAKYGNINLESLAAELRARKNWKGLYRRKPSGVWTKPHFTKLKSSSVLGMQPDFSSPYDPSYLEPFKESLAYSSFPCSLSSDDSTGKKTTFANLVFYDVEATVKDAFLVFKPEGYQEGIAPIWDFPRVVKFCRDLFSNGKHLIFIAYNDAYDGAVLYSSYLVRKEGYGDAEKVVLYRELSDRVLGAMDHVKRVGAYYKSLGGSYDYPEDKKASYDYLKAVEKDGLFADVRYNPLTRDSFSCWFRGRELKGSFKDFEYIPSFYTFDLFGEVFKRSGSLKYHSCFHGLEWTASLGGDLQAYAREDVRNLEKLFYKVDGGSVLSTIMALNPGKRPSRALSGMLEIFIHGKNRFGWHWILMDLKDRSSIDSFVSKIAKEGKWRQDKGERVIYGGKTPLRGGKGGVHSDLPSCWLTPKDGVILDLDFASFYPRIMADPSFDLLNAIAKSILTEMLEELDELKGSGNPKRDVIKRTANSFYGSLDMPSRGGFKGLGEVVTARAKSLIVELLRYVERIAVKVIDVNTDGVIALFPPGINPEAVIGGWSSLPLEVKRIDAILYKCAGNYIALSGDKSKRKGSWLATSNMGKGLPRYNASFNILNLGDIVEAGLRGREFPRIRILKKTGSGEDAEFRVIDNLPFDVTPPISSPMLIDANVGVTLKERDEFLERKIFQRVLTGLLGSESWKFKPLEL